MSIQSFLDKLSLNKSGKKSAKLGIALGGGGARGFAHLGVLQALKERDIEPDMIAGTSAGSMVGAFLASGMEPKEVLKLLKQKNLFGYSKIHWPKEGLMSLTGLKKTIEDQIEYNRIEDLPIKLIITVTNLNKGQVEYLDKGSLASAVIASSSIPFIFKPVEINGSKYVDGGVIDNLPVKPLMERCKKVVAVSISPIEEADNFDNLIKIAARTFQISINAQNNELQKKCAVYIEPEGIRGFDIFDVDRAGELYQLGYDSVTDELVRKLS